ncbi:MAG TPA: STAS domain-containing protein [Acidimicrobiales bacterium]|jgi:anti-anti-sigma factor|nr:STAS domain-containing protein [Acidimicrobiales bacterium]
MARIEAELTIDHGRAIVSLGGALDVSNAHRLGALLRRLVTEGCSDIVVDLSTASAIDGSGIGILRGAARAVERSCDGRLRFRNAPAALLDTLLSSGLVEHEEPSGETPQPAVTKPAREPQPPSLRQPGRTTRSRVPRP